MGIEHGIAAVSAGTAGGVAAETGSADTGSTGTRSTEAGSTEAGSTGSGGTQVRFDTKIAVLLRDDLEVWQRLNVTAFLVSGLGTVAAEVVGEPYADADGTAYLPMFRQPVMVFEGGKETLTAAHGRALSRALLVGVFTSDLFTTGNDRDNRAAVRAVHTGRLDLVGIAVHGPRNAVDKALKGAHMHP
jgi:hypothetical protein